jgi:hypothetical protein
MANDIEGRLGKLEMNFDAYMAMFYKWLDELHTDMKDVKEIQALLAENDRKIIETQRLQAEDHRMLVKLFQAIDRKLDDHEGRLAAGNL